MALSALALSSCEDNGSEESSPNFDGKWAFVGDYYDGDGWDYYRETDIMLKISGDRCDVYCANGWDAYLFEDGYFYDCSESDFTLDCSLTFTVDNGKAIFEYPNDWEVTDMYIKDGKLYLHDATDDGYREMYERVKGFK